ncbi:phage tail protein [uncultured Alsobacter sp.]|uniref:phage tail protein n=1 Tax=uncultured Alsobacter sp. TaxID=1748258 RepID=UPI0025CED9F4|nr:phage tail protein [uncultured Alsobacter sp.]
MLALVLAFLVAQTGPASADPISALILGAVSTSLAASATAVAVTTFVLTSVASLALSFVTSKLFAPKQKKSPTNLDSSINVTTREALAPRRLVYGRTRLGGTIVFIGTTDNNLFLHMVIVLCEGPIDGVETIYFNDVAVVTDPTNGYALSSQYNVNGNPYAIAFPYLGSEDQAASHYMTAFFPSQWTADHRLRGCAYLYVRLQWDANIFTTGLPNITAVVRGNRNYDPRTGTRYWSDNAALCIRDYMLRPHNKGGVGAGPDEIDEDNMIAQANICDEIIPLSDGTTERRYTLNGVIQMDSQNSPQSTIETMLSACAGEMPWSSGVFYLLVGAWRPPVFEITDTMIVAPIKVEPRRPLAEQFNAVKGSFVNPAARYEAADYPAITSAVFEAEDNGNQIFKDLPLEFTQSSSMAQRLARIELRKSREPIGLTLTCDMRAYQLTVGDVVTMTRARYGWASKAFVVTVWRWAIAKQDDVPRLAIELTLRETSAAVYDWSATDEQLLAAAPATNLPRWNDVGAVFSVTLSAGTADLLMAGDGSVVSRIRVTWVESVDAFVNRYEIRWKQNTDLAFGAPVTVAAGSASFFISPVEDGQIYVVEVRAVSILGAVSEWRPGTVLVTGKTEAPPDIANIRIADGVLTWDYPNPPPDLAGFKVRYQVGKYVFWPSAIDAHSALLAAGFFDASSLLSGTITFMVKAVDTSGNESATPAVVITDLGDYLVDNVILDEDLKAAGFLGTISSGAVSGGDLVGVSTGLFWPSSDVSPFWLFDDNGLFWPTDTYTDIVWAFSFEADSDLLGSTMSIASTIEGRPWTILFRDSGNTAFWPSSDGALFWGEDADLFWGPEGDFVPWSGQSAVRATRYDFIVTVSGGSIQPRISAFNLLFDVPDIMESIGDVAVLAAGTLLPLTKTYRAIEAVQLTLQAGAGGAVTARIESKSPSGVLVKALNAAGTPVDATLDAIVQGY